MAIDINAAIQYACCVQAAEVIAPTDLTNRAGTQMPLGSPANKTNYDVIATVYGNDLATPKNNVTVDQFVSFGFVLQDPAGGVVLAIRGTNGIIEWFQDAVFPLIPSPILPGSGKTEQGFTSVYLSLCMAPAVGATRLVNALEGLTYPRAITSVTIAGHSLGGSLVTLLGLDVAVHTKFKTPTVYSYASPKTGDPQFADTFNQVVPNSFRIANRLDIVPALPPPDFGYQHVKTFAELTPGIEVKIDPFCRHHLTTYLYVLGKMVGVAGFALNPECKFP